MDYPDGTYEIIQEESRGNVLLISNNTQHGLSGMGSSRRTALFTFFGKNIPTSYFIPLAQPLGIHRSTSTCTGSAVSGARGIHRGAKPLISFIGNASLSHAVPPTF